jgi:hypothetical protein
MKIKVYVVDVKLPRWARRALTFGAVPAVLLGLGAFVHAMTVEPPFTPGEVLSAKTMTARFGQIVTVTPWVSYPATMYSTATTGTVASETSAFYRRVGDTIEVNLKTEVRTCSTTGGQLRWPLPAGITPDFTKLPYDYAIIGHGNLLKAIGLQVYAQGPASTFVAVDYLGSAAGGMGCAAPDPVAGRIIVLSFSFPVSGWTVGG